MRLPPARSSCPQGDQPWASQLRLSPGPLPGLRACPLNAEPPLPVCREPRDSQGQWLWLPPVSLTDLTVGALRALAVLAGQPLQDPPSSVHLQSLGESALGLRPRRQRGVGRLVSSGWTSHRGSLELRAETECRGRAACRISSPRRARRLQQRASRIPGEGCGLPECLQLSGQWPGRALTQSLTLGRRQDSLESLFGPRLQGWPRGSGWTQGGAWGWGEE